MTEKKPDVTLSTPVKIDGKDVTAINLRRPKTGDMRGLKIRAVHEMDVDTFTRLLPRITMPPLSPAQIADLELPDFVALSEKAFLFFTTPEQLKEINEHL